MVSAFEAHAINVTAHVENAMTVGVDHIDYGTVFPEEWLIRQTTLGVSSSFCEPTQTRVSVIEYQVWVVEKPDPNNPPSNFPWLGDALYIGIEEDPNNTSTAIRFPVGVGSGILQPVGAGAPPILVLSRALDLHKASNQDPTFDFGDLLIIGLDVPVFEGFWNAKTDVDPKPSGLSGPTVVIETSDTDRYFPDGEYPNGDPVILGADIVIQITDIHNPKGDGSPCV